MKVMDRLGKFFNGDDIEDGYIHELESEEENYEDEVQHAPATGSRQYADPSYQQPVRTLNNTPNVAMSSGSSIEMKVVKPDRFETVTQIADLLLSKKTVLLNLEDTNKETSRRLIDFLSGIAYAIEGDLKRIANNTFVITPHNVAVSNEQVKKEEGSETDY